MPRLRCASYRGRGPGERALEPGNRLGRSLGLNEKHPETIGRIRTSWIHLERSLIRLLGPRRIGGRSPGIPQVGPEDAVGGIVRDGVLKRAQGRRCLASLDQQQAETVGGGRISGLQRQRRLLRPHRFVAQARGFRRDPQIVIHRGILRPSCDQPLIQDDGLRWPAGLFQRARVRRLEHRRVRVRSCQLREARQCAACVAVRQPRQLPLKGVPRRDAIGGIGRAGVNRAAGPRHVPKGAEALRRRGIDPAGRMSRRTAQCRRSSPQRGDQGRMARGYVVQLRRIAGDVIELVAPGEDRFPPAVGERGQRMPPRGLRVLRFGIENLPPPPPPPASSRSAAATAPPRPPAAAGRRGAAWLRRSGRSTLRSGKIRFGTPGPDTISGTRRVES